jgi:hypothetical protein
MLDGLHADEQRVRDLEVVPAVHDQGQHLELARCERADPGRRRAVRGQLAQPRDHGACRALGEQPLARRRRADDPGHDLLGRLVLGQIATRAGGERVDQLACVDLGGEHDDPGAGSASEEPANEIGRRRAELDVGEDDVGRQACRAPQRVIDRARVADDVEALAFEHQAQSGSE